MSLSGQEITMCERKQRFHKPSKKSRITPGKVEQVEEDAENLVNLYN